jgi:hypothetical protein
MMKVFFDVNGMVLIYILPAKTKLSSNYIRQNNIKELGLVAYPTGRKPHSTGMPRHFDNAPVHNTQTVA